MKTSLILILISALIVCACESKSTASAKERAAYFAGRQQGQVTKTDPNTVWVVGNVQTPLVPWTEELTLAKAIVAAGYKAANDPGQIVLLRDGQPSIFVSAEQLLNGFDLPLQPGDRIEIRP